MTIEQLKAEIAAVIVEATDEFNQKNGTDFKPQVLNEKQIVAFVRATYRQRLTVRANGIKNREFSKQVQARLKKLGINLDSILDGTQAIPPALLKQQEEPEQELDFTDDPADDTKGE